MCLGLSFITKFNFIYQLNGKKGVTAFKDYTFSDDTGHFDLFNGRKVEGYAYFKECNSYIYINLISLKI